MLITSSSALFTPSSLPWVELTRLTQDRHGMKVGHRVQHHANAAWAERMGVTIGAWRKESNVSTSDTGVYREVYEQILQEVEGGLWGGIVVWRADRLVRLSYEFERCLRITEGRRALIAVSCEGWTTIDADGVDRIRGAVAYAEREVRNLKVRVKANSAQRSERGMYHGGGNRPWCFEGPKKDKRTGRLKNSGRIGIVHVKTEVALARDAAKRIAWQGESYPDVINDWHSRTPPVYGVTGSPWSVTTLRNALTSPRMIGKQVIEVVDPETGATSSETVKADWKPVLDKKTWRQLVSMVKTESHKPTRTRYLLSPVSECGRCHCQLSGATRKYMKGGELTPTRTYRCRSHPENKALGACGKLNVIAEPVEKLVVARIFQRLLRTREFGAGVRETDDIQDKITRACTRLETLQAELAALEEAQRDRANRLPVAKFLEFRRPILADLEAANSELIALRGQLDVPFPEGDDEWEDLPGWFETLTEGQKSKLVLAHVKKVVVLPPGRSGRYFNPERVVVTLTDTHEADGESD